MFVEVPICAGRLRGLFRSPVRARTRLYAGTRPGGHAGQGVFLTWMDKYPVYFIILKNYREVLLSGFVPFVNAFLSLCCRIAVLFKAGQAGRGRLKGLCGKAGCMWAV